MFGWLTNCFSGQFYADDLLPHNRDLHFHYYQPYNTRNPYRQRDIPSFGHAPCSATGNKRECTSRGGADGR